MGRHGENIHKRKDGRWEARYIQSYRENRAVYRSVYGKSYREAKEKRDAAINRSEKLPLIVAKSSETVDELATAWLEDRRVWIKESSYCHYHQILRSHILPALGTQKIQDLEPEDVLSFLRSLKNNDHDLSIKTITDIWAVLRMILQYGKVLNTINVSMERLSLPNRETPKIAVLTKSEQETLEKVLRNSNDHSLCIAVLLALYTGLRIGEICGLRWEDLDAESRTLRVSRTVLRIRNLNPESHERTKLVVQKPKSSQSKRSIPIPVFLFSEMDRERKPDSYYVLTGTENPTEPRNLQKRLHTFLKHHGMQGYSFHSLRHTFATRCIECGMDVKSLSEIMGHAAVSTTMQMYVHPSMDTKREQINKMESWMLNNRTP